MIVFTSKREDVRLAEKPFASGGEGSIYKVVSAPSHLQNTCVKIYHAHVLNEQREERIKYMVANPPSQIHGEGFMLGWPMDYVTDDADGFLGFVMPLGFPDSKELVTLTATTLSKKLDKEWQDRYDRSLGKKALLSRLKLICNIAIPVHILHSTGKYVLKDFKPQNVLATADGRITICDMDSIQIAEGNSLLFPGTAATPDYMPPEFYSKGIGKQVDDLIDKSWDTFSLGVVFYQLLFGIHPYVVTPKVGQDNDANDISYNISSGLFPFGENGDMVKIRPKLHDKFMLLPQELQDLFIRTFSDQGMERPSAEEWGKYIHEVVMNSPMDDSEGGKAELEVDDKKPTDEKNTNKGKNGKYILILAILALLGVGAYFAFNYEKEEPFSLQVVNFVNQTELNAESFDKDDWKKASKTIDSLKHEYAINYNKLTLEDLDMVDGAIDRYDMIFRQYREIPFEEDTTKIIVDDIEFNNENPTNENLDEWKQKYSSVCGKKLEKIDTEDFSLPQDMLDNHPCLAYLILKSITMSSSRKKQEWLNLYSLMNNEQLYELYRILYKESYIKGKKEKKKEIQEKASKFNTEAYEYANNGDFYNAKMTIDKAKMLMPDNANYYDSEGEFCIMQGRTTRALSLWNKVMELNPNFLQEVNGGTTVLYEKLKEQGFVE